MLNPRSQETAWALAQQLGPQAVKVWLHLGAQECSGAGRHTDPGIAQPSGTLIGSAAIEAP
ncbi:MAG TPA: hypothetical protein VGQ12_15610 [Candidatus Angelobacter sp.]|nr:hypothetical protein [Candidatus Angelobacter sp.]